jgi:hypothetical protein
MFTVFVVSTVWLSFLKLLLALGLIFLDRMFFMHGLMMVVLDALLEQRFIINCWLGVMSVSAMLLGFIPH